MWFALRYYHYRKAGGEGDFWSAMCGPRRKVILKKHDRFKLWPMSSFKPRYATNS